MINNTSSNRRFLPIWLSGIWGAIGIFSFLYVILYISWLYFHWGGNNNNILIGDLFFLPLDFITFVAALRVTVQKELDSKVRRMWLFLSLGFLSYFLGDLTWAYLENVLQVQPFPALPDVFYLLFPPLIAFGLLSSPGISLTSRERRRYIFDLLIIILTSTMLMWYFIIQPTAQINSGDIVIQVVATAYPITDIVLLGGLVSTLLRKPDQDTRSAFRFLFLGLIFFVGADIIYAYTSLLGTYETGSWIDLGWILAQLFFLLAGMRQAYRSTSLPIESPWDIVLDKFFRALPGISVGMGGVVTVFVIAIDFDPKAGLLLSGAGICIILLVLRGFDEFTLRTKFIAIFSTSIVSLTFFIGVFYYYNSTSQSLEDYRNIVKTSIGIAALQQNAEEFEKISSAQDNLYEKFRVQNLKIRYSNPAFIYVYTMRQDEQGIYFVVDAGEPGEENIAAYGERYDDAGPTLAENFSTMTEPIAEPDIYTDKYGSFLSAYAPILTADGRRVGVIAVDIDASTIVNAQRELLNRTLIIVLIAGILSLVLGIIFGNLLINPVIQLTSDTKKFTEGDLSFRTEARTKDEVGKLSQAFNSMVDQIQDLVMSLEAKVIERTKEFEKASTQNLRRARHFEAISKVAREITTNESLDKLLQRLTALISEQFGFYHTGIFLLDENTEYAILQATNSEGGRQMLANGHKLKVGQTGIVGFVSASGKPRIVLDVGDDAVHFDNPELPNTRSEIAFPIRITEKVIGVLDVQSTEVNAFFEEDIEVLSTLADQVAIAIQNARSYESMQALVKDAQKISGTYWQDAWRVLQADDASIGYRVAGDDINPLTRPLTSLHVKRAVREMQTIAESGKNATLAIPIRLRDEVIGVMDIRTQSEHEWDEDEVDIAEAVADRLSLALEASLLLKSTQRRAEIERITADISGKIGATTQFDSILRTAAEELSRVLGGSEVLVQIQSLESTNGAGS